MFVFVWGGRGYLLIHVSLLIYFKRMDAANWCISEQTYLCLQELCAPELRRVLLALVLFETYWSFDVCKKLSYLN